MHCSVELKPCCHLAKRQGIEWDLILSPCISEMILFFLGSIFSLLCENEEGEFSVSVMVLRWLLIALLCDLCDSANWSAGNGHIQSIKIVCSISRGPSSRTLCELNHVNKNSTPPQLGYLRHFLFWLLASSQSLLTCIASTATQQGTQYKGLHSRKSAGYNVIWKQPICFKFQELCYLFRWWFTGTVVKMFLKLAMDRHWKHTQRLFYCSISPLLLHSELWGLQVKVGWHPGHVEEKKKKKKSLF